MEVAEVSLVEMETTEAVAAQTTQIVAVKALAAASVEGGGFFKAPKIL